MYIVIEIDREKILVENYYYSFYNVELTFNLE